MKNIKIHWLEYFDYYEKDQTMVSRLSYEELEDIVGRILFNKRNLPPHLKQMRVDCQKELERRNANIKKYEGALKQSKTIHKELTNDFPDVEHFWKRVRGHRRSHRHGLARSLQKKNGRAIGQRWYDYPKLPTNIYSVNAALNIINCGKINDDSRNTKEHFNSLYSNAGPDAIEEAITLGEDFNIHNYALQTFNASHVTITTKKENASLQRYHTDNKMISPQISYDAVGIKLIHIPRLISKSTLAWKYVFEREIEIEFPEYNHPFTTVKPLEDARSDVDVDKLKALFKLV